VSAGPSTPNHGYTSNKSDLLARLHRIEGQVRGIGRMVEDDRYCVDILTQIAAVRAAVEQVALGLVDGHVRHCMVSADPDERGEKADELVAAVSRLLKAS
jgi:CsoR family transcriptional regulator, copper-sensing transcriptional repressor